MKNLLFVFAIISCLPTFAQDEKSLEKFPYDWAESFDLAHEKDDLGILMKHYDRSLTFENNIVQIDGQVTENQGDYFAFENRASQSINMKDLTVKIVAGELHLTKLNGKIGFVNFSVDFEAKLKDKLVAEGTNIYSMALVWKSNKWMITHSSSFGFRDKQYAAACPCTVMKDANGDYNSLTGIPTGVSYAKKQNTFAVSKGADATVFTSNGRKYLWYISGRLVEVTSEGTAPKDLGNVIGSNEDAIKQIIKGSLYEGTCVELVEMNAK